MKKLYFAAIAALMVASCSKQDAAQPAEQTIDQNPSTAAVIDLFTAEEIDLRSFDTNISIDVEGNNIYTSYKGFVAKSDMVNKEYNETLFFIDGLGKWAYMQLGWTAMVHCADLSGNIYIIGSNNNLARVTPDGQYCINLTDKFPANTLFLRLAAADNGNVFVTTTDLTTATISETGDISYTKQGLYRISSTGNVALVSSELYAIGTMPNNMSAVRYSQYRSSINKASGAALYGLDTNKKLFKVGTVNGVVEYFTPRVPVDFIATAKNKTNPYALSGNTIVELRLTLAKDVVVGTIPSSIANKPIYAFLTNADATVFYVLTEYQTLYKLTLN